VLSVVGDSAGRDKGDNVSREGDGGGGSVCSVVVDRED
jgi:hypothetical protein